MKIVMFVFLCLFSVFISAIDRTKDIGLISDRLNYAIKNKNPELVARYIIQLEKAGQIDRNEELERISLKDQCFRDKVLEKIKELDQKKLKKKSIIEKKMMKFLVENQEDMKPNISSRRTSEFKSPSSK